MTPPQNDGGRLSGDRLNRIRADLDKRDPKERAKAEKDARAQVEKAARSPEERRSLLAMIFGRK